MDTRVRFEMRIPHGAAAKGALSLTVETPGKAPRTFKVVHPHRPFSRLERAVISSNTKKKSVFHIDDIAVEPID